MLHFQLKTLTISQSYKILVRPSVNFLLDPLSTISAIILEQTKY